MKNYNLHEDTYILEDYDKLPPFSSFLPGLTGINGIPLWVFYTNRGQGINSFGIHNKNNAIMEFNPANTAYENTSTKGFRTFIKCNGVYYEPFFTLGERIKRNLYIKKNSIRIEDVNSELGLKVTVNYFVLPKESIGALVRSVEIENIGEKKASIEMMDGMPKIIPYGMHNGTFKEMSNLLKSWTEIINIQNEVPYYTMRASSEDSAEVSEVVGGYYYAAFSNGVIKPVIYDPDVVFEYDNSLVNPIGFLNAGIDDLKSKPQYFVNKIPCAFALSRFELSASERQNLTSYIGYVDSPLQVNEKLHEFCKSEYIAKKEQCADELVNELTKDVKTHTSNPVFDQYIEQCYMDNFLRGGYPYVLGKKEHKSVLHLFSRKHGDPERDYNFFAINGEYYSQGNGNFRDVNQNRRNDIFFNKNIDDFNIKTFFQLIQVDGYNPQEVRPSTFSVKEEQKNHVVKLLQNQAGDNYIKLQKIIEGNFTPGQISNCIAKEHVALNCVEDDFLETILGFCDQNIEAGTGEGYWSDHWGYNLDLIENYIKIYPDLEQKLLFGDQSYRFYDNAARVLPRNKKYVLGKNGPRQYGAFVHDEEKVNRKGFCKGGSNWLKGKSGKVIQTSLIVKLISLAINKFALLDPYGMGIEMECGKPGWNDAMNGLPGLFGSGIPETFELKRLINYIRKIVLLEEQVSMPFEICDFMLKISSLLKNAEEKDWEDFKYWDKVANLREEYREKTRFEMDDEKCVINTIDVFNIFNMFANKVEKGIRKAYSYGDGIIPTYFIFQAVDYEMVLDKENSPVISNYGLPLVKVKKFEAQPLPAFLEGPARMLGTMEDKAEAEKLYQNVKNSDIYDHKLKMYKTSGSLEGLSMEAGRIRAFTPGWLERESVFLHMEYKYLFSLLKAGLYENYYEDIQSALIPFLNPEQYGRSILENSSFLASSANPDPKVHGRGFVARLSGSTTEMISMWIEMFMGRRIFTSENGKLELHFEPKLPEWLFDEKGEASFALLSRCNVKYKNPKRKNTYGVNGAKVVSIVIDEFGERIEGNVLQEKYALMVRNGEINHITINLE